VTVERTDGIAAAAAMVGRVGQLRTGEGFVIWVRVLDVRMAYGRMEFQVIAHMTGEGTAWVRTDRVDFSSAEDAPVPY
jgi:hypothetical protein